MNKAFVFPGQGSQTVGMGLDFYNNFDVAKKVFEEVDSALGKNLSKIIFEGPIDVLTQTENAQPAIMCVSIAILKVLEQELGINIEDMCKYVAGHSLGEYSALCASRAISLKDTAKLLKIRGEAFASVGKKEKGGMVSLLGATMEQAEEIAEKAVVDDEVLQIANDNTVGQIVLSGNEKSIEKAIELGNEMKLKKVIKLNVSGAFHSKLMEPACDVMAEALKDIKIKTPVVPVVTNVYANTITDPEEIRKSLLKQIVSRVRWRETMILFKDNNIDEVVEVGPGVVLKKMVARTIDNVNAVSINSVESLKEFTGKD